MSEFHCLDIEFPDVDFSPCFDSSNTEVANSFHAHLYVCKDEIELKVFYEEDIYRCFVEKLDAWTNKIDWKKFGSFIKVAITQNHTNERIQKIDLSEAKLLNLNNGTDYYENNKKYVILKIDTVKFYCNPNEENKYTAEFYLDDKGFRVVEPFYSFLSPKTWFKNDGNFNIVRMNDSKKFYNLGKSTFRPEFHFVCKDEHKNRIATITKEPKIQFRYKKEITEKEAIFYGDVVLMLASFYHHIKIDYIFSRIHLAENTITIKNVEQKNFYDTRGNLSGLEINWDFNKFLQASWQKETIKNFSLILKTITLFNQSHLVDNSSAFLIRYNIIEICDKQKQDNVKFSFVLDKKNTKAKQDEALEKLLDTINTKEHEDFKIRWQNVQTLLQNKPMKNQLVSFLESQNLDPKTFPVSIKDLKRTKGQHHSRKH